MRTAFGIRRGAPRRDLPSRLPIYGDPYSFYNDAARRVATFFEKWNCLIERGLPDGKEDPKKIDPYWPFAAFSLLECGGLDPILPCLGGRSDAARRVDVKRMREEHFNHALPVLVVMRFLWGGLCGVFLPLAGVCGRRGFWAWACARDSRYARGRAGALGGRSASRAKALGTFARGELSFPPFFGVPKKGGAGAAGARSPPGTSVGFSAFCVTTAARPT